MYHNFVCFLPSYVCYTLCTRILCISSDEVTEFLSIYLIFPAVLDPGVYSASNSNEYQKQKNSVSGQ
jgi:hypothetical protein